MNLDGVIEKTYGSRVFKGSNGVTEIALFAPFDPQSTVIINFTLPDGTEIPGIMIFADFSVEDHYNMWVYKLRQNVTSMEGRVTLSFEIRAYVDETEVTTTAETHIYIEKSSSTTFLDEVDEFLALANEALARSQQALNLNQATNEAMEIEIERNNEQDNAIATINQTLISQQNAIDEHGNELENLRQETNEAMEIEVERNNEQDNAISAINQTLTNQQNVINDHSNKLENLSELPSRMNRAEQNIGVLNNQVNALPNPQDILTKQNYKMPDGYAPTQPHHLADKKYVDDVVEAMSGTNPEHFVTHAQMEEALYKPDFIDFTIDEPVYHITESTLDSPQEIQVIEGNTVEIDGQLLPVKNPVIESVGRNLFDAYEWARHVENTVNDKNRVEITTFQGKNVLKIIKAPNVGFPFNVEGEFSVTLSSYNIDYTASYMSIRSGDKIIYIYTRGPWEQSIITGTQLSQITVYSLNTEPIYIDLDSFMINKGSTPLPYEPFRSTKLAINGEYHRWDKIINDGGVYWDEVGSGQIAFDGSEGWDYYSGNQSIKTDVATFYCSIENISLYTGYSNVVSNYFPFVYNVWNKNEVGISSHNAMSNIYINILKSELENYSDELSSLKKRDLFRRWLQDRANEGNPITVVYQLATPTRKPTSITKAGDPDFSQGNTIYLHSDTEAIPTVHAKVAMDIAGQVNQLTKDSYEKGKKIHELEVKITDDITNLKQDVDQNTSDIAEIQDKVTDVENDINYIGDNINTLNTEVSGINQTITDLEDAVSQNSSIIINLQNELATSQNEIATLQDELATLRNSMPKGVNDATLTIDGVGDGGSLGMESGEETTFTLEVTGLDFYKVNWSVIGDDLRIESTDGDKVTLRALTTGPGRSLTATITDVYGKTKSITIRITVYGHGVGS